MASGLHRAPRYLAARLGARALIGSASGHPGDVTAIRDHGWMSQPGNSSSTTRFVTGASRGFGRELTEQLLSRGDRVAATLRRPVQLDDLAAHYGDRLWVRALDVTDTAQLRRVVREAFTDLGRVDVVGSNGGYGLLGAAEDLTDAQIETVISANLTASIQLAR